MRIYCSTTQRWPAAAAAITCLARVVAAAGLDDTPGQVQDVISFVDESFTIAHDSEAAVYSVFEATAPIGKTFYWTTTQFASVTDAWLIGGDADYIVHQSPDGKVGLPPTTTAAVNDNVAAGSKDTKRQSSEVKLFVTANSTGGSITIQNLIPIGEDPNGGYGNSLHFKLSWNQTGESYSRTFTVTDFANTSLGFQDLVNKFSSDDPAFEETTPASTGGSQTVSASVGTSTATTSVALTTTAAGPASTAPLSSNDKGGGGGGGGLSTGAIAGIAVGCGVVGLALVGALVWFFCFRRRRGGDGVSAAPYGSDRHHRTQELIAEKEANAGVTESSPHSPYSDDGQQQQQYQHASAGMNGSSIPLQQQQQQPTSGHDSAHFVGAAAPIMAPSPHPHSVGERSYTPYSDHRGSGIVAGTPETQQSQPVHYEQQQQQQSERGAPSPAPAPSSQQPTSAAAAAARSVSPQQQQQPTGRYAHLVEEGMTEDEIWRLEEEERQLDAAIADREAGRGR